MAGQRLPLSGVSGLAAARAALDPDRAAWRSDILLSSVVELLSAGGPKTERELLNAVQGLWLTKSVTTVALREALNTARSADLIYPRQQGKADVRWAASESAASEAKQDREWAVRALQRFERQMADRIAEHTDDPEVINRSGRLSNILIAGLIEGSQRVFESIAHIGEDAVSGPIAFESAKVREYIASTVNPPPVAEIVAALAHAVLDPSDEFGTEIVRLIAQGQVMHGLMSRHDLGDQRITRDALLLLDTTTLFYSLPRSGPQAKLLEEFLSLARDAECDVTVTRSVLDEWRRVWEAADGEHVALSFEGAQAPAPYVGILSRNVAIKEWYRADALGDGPSWEEFRSEHIEIEKWLLQRGVRIFDSAAIDPALTSEFLEAIKEVDDFLRRSHAAAITDAKSAAVVCQFRDNDPDPLPRGWFIARERLTSLAYKQQRPDDGFPLALTAEKAVIVLAAARMEEPHERRRLVEILGDTLIKSSFFALATGLPTDDLLSIVDTFSDSSGVLDEAAMAESVRADYVALASGSVDLPAQLARRRANRRNEQARRREEQVARDEADLQKKLDQARKSGEAASEANVDFWQEKYRKLRRGFSLLVSVLVLSGFAYWSFIAVDNTLVRWVGPVLVLVLIAEGLLWVNDLRVTTRAFILTFLVGLGWTLIGVLTQSDGPSTPQGIQTLTPALVAGERDVAQQRHIHPDCRRATVVSDEPVSLRWSQRRCG